MLKKSIKDQSGKLNAVAAVLKQLSVGTLEASDLVALTKFHSLVQHWTELAASELAKRDDQERR